MKSKKAYQIQEWLAWLLVVPGTILFLAAGLRFLLNQWRDRLPWAPSILPPDLDELEGLTDEEAASRRIYDPEEENRQARKKINLAILRRNTISIFNISLLGLSIATFLLDDWLGALTTLGVMLANIVVNTVQQAFAVAQVDKIAAQSRPMVNAIRSGKSKGIGVDEIVLGDILVVGLGGQILADGQIVRAADDLLVDDSTVGQGVNKEVGDVLQAGNYCLQGWAAYEVQTLPAEELRTTQLNAIPETSAELTSLQKVIDRILRILLFLTAIFVLLLVQSIMQWDVVPPDVQKLYRDAASIIFSIAPSGLFFMIIVSYNMGTFDLLKLGALVRDSRSVESLAQVTTICFGKSGTLTGIDVGLEMLSQSEDGAALGENRVRQIVGDYAHNSSSLSPLLAEMRKAFEGQPRRITAESHFLSTYGWGALNFHDPDLQGTYVLGIPGLFQIDEHLAKEKTESDESESEGDSIVQKTWGRLSGIFRRNQAEAEQDSKTEDILTTGEGDQPILEEDPSSVNENLTEDHGTGFLHRMRNRIASVVRRQTTEQDADLEPEEPVIEATRLVFAYSPDEQKLFDPSGRPTLPPDLTPLSILTFTEQVRPEAKKAIDIFTDAGVQVKITSLQDARSVVSAARQLGLEGEQPGGLKTLSGMDIERIPTDQLSQTLKETIVFAPVTSQQKGKIITSLRNGEEYTAMTGQGLTDVDAMQRANLSIAVQGGTQAAVSFADIILLRDSLQALPQVLQQGRRIVNGLIDVLKLNLVQVAYIFFLLVAMVLLKNKVFFYDPTQGGLIVFFTIVIPSLGLTFWATSGTISEQRIQSQLLRFVIPVGFTSALASLVVYYIFQDLTGDRAYAQLGVTYILSLTGMLMVLFIKPPDRFWVGDSPLSGDRRFVWMVMVMFILFGVALNIPLAQDLLKVDTLRESAHYLIIAGVTLTWIVLTKLIWLLPGLRLRLES